MFYCVTKLSIVRAPGGFALPGGRGKDVPTPPMLKPTPLPTLLCLSTLWLSAHLAGAQTVANPGFDSSLASWSASTSGVGWSSTGGNTSAGCALFTANATGHASIGQTVGGLLANTPYKAVVYAHLGATGKATLWVQNYGGAEVSAIVTSTTAYQRLEVDFTTGASNTSAQLFFGNNSTSTVYADDFSVTPFNSPDVPPSSPQYAVNWKSNDTFSDEFNGTALDTTKWQTKEQNWLGRSPSQFDPHNVSVSGGVAHLLSRNENLLPNGNFETGTLADWTATGSATITNYFPTSGNEAIYQTYGVKLDTGANIQQLVSGLKPSTTYRLEGSFRIGTGTEVTLSAAGFGNGNPVSFVFDSTNPVAKDANGNYRWISPNTLPASNPPPYVSFTTGPSGTSAVVTVSNTGAAGTVYADELIVIPATLADGASLNVGNYVSASTIESLNAPPYGFYEARMKPSNSNCFSAFWFWYPGTGASDPHTEIDVAEENGNPTHATTDVNGNLWADDMKITTHYFVSNTDDRKHTAPTPVDVQVAGDFHVYGVDWESDAITFFFDGRQVQQFAQVVPPAVPAPGSTDQTQVLRLDWLELSTEVQVGYGILDGSTDFQVDYIRAWTK